MTFDGSLNADSVTGFPEFSIISATTHFIPTVSGCSYLRRNIRSGAGVSVGVLSFDSDYDGRDQNSVPAGVDAFGLAPVRGASTSNPAAWQGSVSATTSVTGCSTFVKAFIRWRSTL